MSMGRTAVRPYNRFPDGCGKIESDAQSRV
jgi:hypothetical protein